MKLPSGQEVKDETLSEIADFLAMDMLALESSYNDACQSIAESLEDGYEGDHESLIGISEEDRTYLLEAVRKSTIMYLEVLRGARNKAFDKFLRDKDWDLDLGGAL